MIKAVGVGALSATGIAGVCGGAFLLMKEKTIGDRIRKSGLSLIKVGDAPTWKLAAKHLKLSDNSLPTDLTKFDSSITSKETLDLDKAKVALEKWCLEASMKDLSDPNIKDYLDKVKSRCTIPPSNIGEKLKKEGKSFTGDWSGKFNSLKTKNPQDSELESDLKKHDSSITENLSGINTQTEKYVAALEKWCGSKFDLKLEHGDYEGTYPKVVSRCV